MKKKNIDPIEIAEELARQGKIPEDFKEEFAKELAQELLRETRRLGSNLAGVAARMMLCGRISQLRMAA